MLSNFSDNEVSKTPDVGNVGVCNLIFDVICDIEDKCNRRVVTRKVGELCYNYSSRAPKVTLQGPMLALSDPQLHIDCTLMITHSTSTSTSGVGYTV